MSNTSKQIDNDEQKIELRDPGVAALLAWLIPGLGHYYQGRKAKAILFFVCIMGTFTYGCYLGGSSELGWGRVVYFSRSGPDARLHYLCQVGIGLPALPALVQAVRVSKGHEPLFGGFMAPPRRPATLTDDHNRQLDVLPTGHLLNADLNRSFELGTVYTMVAGLLYLIVVFDAAAGPVFPVAKREEDDEDEGNDDDADSSDNIETA